MDIIKNIEGSEVTLQLVGRLDTTTAPQLEAEVKDLEGVTTLNLDFAELEYLSSAGLRVLLSTQKAMSRQGNLVLHNVNEDIMEVFEMTGFADLLTFA